MFEAVRQFGLGIVLSLSILSIAWFLLHQVFRLIRNLIETHFKNQEKAHEYQRSEHEKIMNGLQEIIMHLKVMNGNK